MMSKLLFCGLSVASEAFDVLTVDDAVPGKIRQE
jgi:hypothetical protein